MTKKVFWEDPYVKQLITTVTSVNGNEITVDATIFFAFSGGQESDFGVINGFKVIEAKKEGTEIIYTLEENHHLKVGDEVEMVIDWSRRYRLMRLHFAAEIILELVYKHLNPIEKIGAHISEEKARIDFIWDKNISMAFEMILKDANELIHSNYDIISEFSDPEQERRYWKIENFAKVSCGGTHLKKTGEIGSIQLKRVNLGKGKERIEIYLVE